MITHNKQELVHHFAMLALLVAADGSTTFPTILLSGDGKPTLAFLH